MAIRVDECIGDNALTRVLAISYGREAAVDVQLHPIHEARIVGSKKQRGRGDFFSAPHLSPRDQGFEHSLPLLVENLVLHRCGDRPRVQHIHPDIPALRAVFDPQLGTALSAIHNKVNTPWTVESMAAAASMSRSAFAARFKELLGQTPLEYVTEWRMQKAMHLLKQRDKKVADVARSVGYESDAAFSKAFKRVVGTNPGEYLKRGI